MDHRRGLDADVTGGHETADGADLPAGRFSVWLADMVEALAGHRDVEVACGTCSACCSSSQFVHVAPDETAALEAIPADLLFAAPGLAPGHLVMGYDEHGCCPMLVDGACSIYHHRPRTCRTYDCRIFPAAGVEPEVPAKVDIAVRSARWRFEHADARDIDLHRAVRAAADHLRSQIDGADPGQPTPSATQVAVRAVEIHGDFVRSAPVAPERADGDGDDQARSTTRN